MRAVPESSYDDDVPAVVEPWLWEAMATLTPRQRSAVVLRFVDDLDLKGIAQVMGCSVGTAKSHLSRGLERLRERAPAGSAASAEEESRG